MNAGKSKEMVCSSGVKMIVNSGSGPVVSLGKECPMGTGMFDTICTVVLTAVTAPPHVGCVVWTLIRKMLQTNIPGTIIKFIANYIKGRNAYTTYINHTFS